MTTESLAQRLGLEITQHLRSALTHSSRRGRGAAGMADPFQRLEFLGDRVLGLIIAQALYDQSPNAAEGPLSRRLHDLVRTETLADIAKELEVDKALKADHKGTQLTQGVLADSLEAIIGAVYLGEGLEAVRRFVLAHWEERLTGPSAGAPDAKNALQEWAQAQGYGLPVYECLAQDGPAHAPTFKCAVYIGVPNIDAPNMTNDKVDGQKVNELRTATGTGTSKRQAEKQAATALLEMIETLK